MGALRFLAGARAFRRIREQGLSPADVRVAVGASGAAKWLVLHGLDTAIFGHWLQNSPRPVQLFGTSIGGWKFAAATRKDAVAGFDLLANAYIEQRYGKKATTADVGREVDRMLAELLPEGSVREILDHPVYRLGFSSVRCKGRLSSEGRMDQVLGVGRAYLAHVRGRAAFEKRFERVVFHDPRMRPHFVDSDRFSCEAVPLSRENFRQALAACGAIPMVSPGVRDIPGATAGTYRDGGLLDYHPVFPFVEDDGIALYPHFYPVVRPGWFDKKMAETAGRAGGPVRRARSHAVRRVRGPSPPRPDSRPAGFQDLRRG